MPEPHPTDLIPAGEAASLIGVDRSTITRWIEKEWITGHRLSNGQILFARSEVERARAAHIERARVELESRQSKAATA